MNKRFLMVLLVSMIAILQASAKADEFDYHAADVGLLQAKSVQKELKVSEAQRARMNKHADAHRAGLQKLESEIKNSGKKPEEVSFTDPRIQNLMGTLKRNVLGELSAAQLKRLREISLQRVGLVALMDPMVAKKIGISETQRSKIKDLYGNGVEKASTIEKAALKKLSDKYKAKNPKTDAEKKALAEQLKKDMAASSKSIAPQINAIRADTRKRILAVLNAKQKQSYEALQGKKFTPQG